MEKKKVKKLQLSKETLRDLHENKLQNAVGGITGTRPCTECGQHCASGVFC